MPDLLTEAQQFAFAALAVVTPEATIGEFAGEVEDTDGVTSYSFETTMPGYPGWNWTVTIARIDGAEPTVVETELVPAEGALLAPDWVPWSERMDDYRAAQAALGEAPGDGDAVATADSDAAGDDPDDSDDDESDDDDSDDEDDDDSDDDDDLDDDDDDDDDDDFGSDVLHSGDVDGVDIDELDPSADAVDEGDEPESESGDAAEEPPVVTARRQRVRKDQHEDESD
jgi:hypothetical protein